MAKAQFHRNQKVWVESVGAWAVIEKITPVWAKGFDEPVRITYDCGLGRPFSAQELRAQSGHDEDEGQKAPWRLLRARNKWQQVEECGHHPYPGTFPVIVTDPSDWGGWRVPGAEYDRAPRKIEYQARLIAAAPDLLAVAQQLLAFVAEAEDDCPSDLVELAQAAASLIRSLDEIPMAPEDSGGGSRKAPGPRLNS
jgi:hypothetical protein